MPPSKKSVPLQDTTQACGSDLQHLIEAVEALRMEVKVLREVIDAIRDDCAWALTNDKVRCFGPCHVMHITSMPKDPATPDFGKRVNQFNRDNAPEAFASSPPAAEDESPRDESIERQPGELF